MIKIEIRSAEVVTKSGVSARTGKPYSMNEQRGYAFTCDRQGNPQPYPSQLCITLANGVQPYQPGLYTLAPSSLYTNKYDQLEISPNLVPISATLQKAA